MRKKASNSKPIALRRILYLFNKTVIELRTVLELSRWLIRWLAQQTKLVVARQTGQNGIQFRKVDFEKESHGVTIWNPSLLQRNIPLSQTYLPSNSWLESTNALELLTQAIHVTQYLVWRKSERIYHGDLFKWVGFLYTFLHWRGTGQTTLTPAQ